ncbi:MAG: ATP-binding protein [Spirochaetia bacterium]
MNVKSVYRRSYTVVNSYTSVERIKSLLLDKSCVVLMDGKSYQGILEIRDIVENNKVLAVDCAKPKKIISPEWDIKSAFEYMAAEKIEFLPVMEQDDFKGILSYDDVVNYFKESETALCESEKQYRFLYNNVLDAIFMFNFDSGGNKLKIYDVNDWACEKLEYSRDELIHLPCEIIISPNNLCKFFSALRRAANGGHYHTDLELVTRSKTALIMDFNLQSVTFDGKDIIFAVGRDITDRIRREAALASSKEQLKIALDTAGKSVWEWDLAAGKITITCQIPSLLGYFPEDDALRDDELSSVLGADGIERLKASISRHLAGNSPSVEEEFHALCADGSRHWIQVEGKTLNRKEDGDPVKIMGVVSDIESRKQTEHYLMNAKREAEEANLRKSLFIADFGHEVRNALTSVSGVADLLKDSDVCNDEEIQEYIEILKMSSGTILELIKDVLDFSKLESENIQLESTPFDLVNLINSVVRIFSIKKENPNLTFDVSIEPEVPRHLLGDPTRLTQILTNLISNAVKFTSQGSIRMSAALKKQTTEKAVISFSVTDTGIGISREKMETIFRPFTQAELSTARKFGGTGLGLAICKKLAKAMGGDIKVESTEGEGSTFSFNADFVPQKAAPNLKEPGILAVSEEKKPMHVLIVEDDEISRKMAQKLFEKNVAKVTVSHSGSHALSLMEKISFDLVVMDGHMEGMNGVEATRRIRQMNGRTSRTVPVVALTGDSGVNIRADFLKAGADHILLKPLNLEKINSVLTS